jgi:hypothetical protein
MACGSLHADGPAATDTRIEPHREAKSRTSMSIPCCWKMWNLWLATAVQQRAVIGERATRLPPSGP